MSQLLLSHCSEDAAEAIAIREWLKEKSSGAVLSSFDPLTSEDQAESWRRELQQNASRCEAVIFVVSRHWLSSEPRRSEYELARKLNKRIIVALIETFAIEELPLYLRDAESVSLAAGDNPLRFRVPPEGAGEGQVAFSPEGIEQLETALARAAIDPRSFAWPPADEPLRPPYRGLEPLQACDAGIFFGRQRLLVETLDAIRGLSEAPGPRVLAILGASGVGKSSFLKAGLFPRLARDKARFLPLPVIRPELAPLSGANGLVAALFAAAEAEGQQASQSQIREAVAGGATALRPLLKLLAKGSERGPLSHGPRSIVLLVDQAEELFRDESKTEAQDLLSLIGSLVVGDDPAVIALFAIESTSYEKLEQASALAGMPHRIIGLPPLSTEDFKSVIEGPAERLAASAGKLEIDRELSDLLGQDGKKLGGDALPLLAFTLEQLYRLRGAANRIARSEYEKSGALAHSIDAALGRVLVAADAQLRIPEDGEARLALMRRGLIPFLASVDSETRRARRRVAHIEQIPDDARPIIELLLEQRLILSWVDPATGQTKLELAHDVLLRRWGHLKRWLEEDFGRLAVLESVKRAAREWDAHGRPLGLASHGGARLDEAERLYARPDFTAMLDSTDRAYLAACMQNEKALREAEEKQRRSDERIERAERLERGAAAGRPQWIYALALGTAFTAAMVLGSIWRPAGKDDQPKTATAQANTAKELLSDLSQKLFPGLLNGAHERQAASSGAASPIEQRRDQSVVLNKTVEARLTADDLKGALAAAQESVSLMEAVSASNPADLGWRRDLSVSYEKLGDVQKSQGDLAGALESYRKDAGIAEALVAANPKNAQWRWDLSVSYEKIGDVLKSKGDLEGALKFYRDDLAIREVVSASDPSNVERRRDLAVSSERMGATLAQQNRADGAITAFERALSIYQEILRARPGDRQAMMFSIVPHWRLAGLDRPKAREHLEAALAILESLAAADRLDAKRKGWISEVKAELAALGPSGSAQRSTVPEAMTRTQ